MRLIDADALLQRAVSHGWSTPKWVSDIMIDDAPTIDAEPVKHGHWIDGAICSVCGELATALEARYCENCGAKMDGGEK